MRKPMPSGHASSVVSSYWDSSGMGFVLENPRRTPCDNMFVLGPSLPVVVDGVGTLTMTQYSTMMLYVKLRIVASTMIAA